MKKEVMLLLFSAAVYLTAGEVNAQFSENPPEPMATTTTDARKGDCGSGDGGTVGGVPPPVGLCLPINDYLMPLLIAGIFLGGYKVRSIEKAA